MAKRTCIRWTAAIVILWTVVAGCSEGSRPVPEETPAEELPDDAWPPPDPPVPEPGADGGTPEPESFDVFGTRQLHPTAAGGRTWAARWDGPPRTLGAWHNDGYQSERGRTDTGLDRHCLGHAYSASLRFDGRAVLEKELKHPHYTPQVVKELWGGRGLRRNTWVGLKVLTYNLPGDRVKQELWLDLTDGRNGGTWRKVHEHIDAGGWSIPPKVAATCGIPADHRITTPQPFIILRNDKVREQWLKKLTVREIVPPTE